MTLRTGGGAPLVSATLALQPQVQVGSRSVEFDFAFTTQETFGPGSFFDSLTISIEAAGSADIWFLLTADASGVAWSPLTPGALTVSPAQVTRSEIPFPELEPKFALQTAFHVSATLPAELVGRLLKADIDLFDNLDGHESLGWLRLVPVPEPAMGCLVLAAAATFLFYRRSRS